MQAPQKIAGPPPQRHVGMDRAGAQRSFLGLASPRFPFAGESLYVFSCRLHSCHHWAVLLVAPATVFARRQIFSIQSYLHEPGTVLGFYPRCAQMQPQKTANPTAVQVRAGTSQRESQNAKACVSHASGRGRGCDRGCETGDRSDRRPSALAAGNELAEESRYALRQCRSHVSARGATDREEIPDPGLRWRGNRAAAASLDATQNGTVECGHTLTSFNIGKNPAVAFDSGLALGLNTRQQQAWMNYGGELELIRALFKKDGILPIPCGNVGVQMGGFYRKEINSVDDLKGLKFRIGGLGGMILAKLGVVPLQIPTADIY